MGFTRYHPRPEKATLSGRTFRTSYIVRTRSLTPTAGTVGVLVVCPTVCENLSTAIGNRIGQACSPRFRLGLRRSVPSGFWPLRGNRLRVPVLLLGGGQIRHSQPGFSPRRKNRNFRRDPRKENQNYRNDNRDDPECAIILSRNSPPHFCIVSKRNVKIRSNHCLLRISSLNSALSMFLFGSIRDFPILAKAGFPVETIDGAFLSTKLSWYADNDGQEISPRLAKR